MLWAAAWLHRASGRQKFLDYLSDRESVGGKRSTFSWDDKYLGAQILVSRLVMEGYVEEEDIWADYKEQADQFLCSCVQRSEESPNMKLTPGGLLWFLPWNNLQYVSTALFSLSIYSNYLADHPSSVQCDNGLDLEPGELYNFVKSQADYILGSNPMNMSLMVGYGPTFPQRIHHRGASIVSIKKDPAPVTCKGGFDQWFSKNEANPNLLEGAVVSTESDDHYDDSRPNYQIGEPTTVTTAPLIGVFAFLS